MGSLRRRKCPRQAGMDQGDFTHRPSQTLVGNIGDLWARAHVGRSCDAEARLQSSSCWKMALHWLHSRWWTACGPLAGHFHAGESTWCVKDCYTVFCRVEGLYLCCQQVTKMPSTFTKSAIRQICRSDGLNLIIAATTSLRRTRDRRRGRVQSRADSSAAVPVCRKSLRCPSVREKGRHLKHLRDRSFRKAPSRMEWIYQFCHQYAIRQSSRESPSSLHQKNTRICHPGEIPQTEAAINHAPAFNFYDQQYSRPDTIYTSSTALLYEGFSLYRFIRDRVHWLWRNRLPCTGLYLPLYE